MHVACDDGSEIDVATPLVEDRYQSLVRRGYAAFNAGDVETFAALMSHDVIQHVPGCSGEARLTGRR